MSDEVRSLCCTDGLLCTLDLTVISTVYSAHKAQTVNVSHSKSCALLTTAKINPSFGCAPLNNAKSFSYDAAKDKQWNIVFASRAEHAQDIRGRKASCGVLSALYAVRFLGCHNCLLRHDEWQSLPQKPRLSLSAKCSFCSRSLYSSAYSRKTLGLALRLFTRTDFQVLIYASLPLEV